MAYVNKLKKTFHRPPVEVCNPIVANSSAGSFAKSLYVPAFNINFTVLAANLTTSVLEYLPEADCEAYLPASGMSGTFAAGACGRVHPMGPAGTATAGTTTTLPTALTINRSLAGYFVRMTGGPSAGDVRRIASNTYGSNSVITPTAAFTSATTAASTYQLITPRLYVCNPHTASTWLYFSRYDWATNAWTNSLSLPSGLAAAWGTDAVLNGTSAVTGNDSDNNDNMTFTSMAATVLTVGGAVKWDTDKWAKGILTVYAGTGVGQVLIVASNTSNALTFQDAPVVALDATSKWLLEKPTDVSNSAKGVITHTNTTNATIQRGTGTWGLANCLANYQVRVVYGTGKGQVKSITSNTTSTLTLSGVWTTALAADSLWVIEPNDGYLYLAGNNSVNLYRYSIVGAAWTTRSPTAARSSAPGAGMSLTWAHSVADAAVWDNPDNTVTAGTLTNSAGQQNGRFFISFRGAAGNALDVYDIALNTWTSGVAYGGQAETFSSGVCYEYDDKDHILISTANSRILRLNLPSRSLRPTAELPYSQGTAIVGDKLFNYPVYMDTGERLDFLYHWRNSAADLLRIPLWHVYGG